jgi:hypothetical protein
MRAGCSFYKGVCCCLMVEQSQDDLQDALEAIHIEFVYRSVPVLLESIPLTCNYLL